jgi:hypothetical protein
MLSWTTHSGGQDGQGSVPVMDWPVREHPRLSQDGAGFGSAIEAGAAGAVGNGDWRCNRLGDAEPKEGRIPRLGGGARRRHKETDGGPHGTLCAAPGLNGTFTPFN